jgi:hypothetical protein
MLDIAMKKPKVAGVLVVVIVLASSWITISAYRTLNPREHTFADVRPLTDHVAIELTRKALIADGYDVSNVIPIDYSPDKVVWSSESGNAEFGVRVEKVDAEVSCRVYQHK